MTQEKLGNLTVLNSHKERTAKFAHHAPHFKRGGHRPPHAKNCSAGPGLPKLSLILPTMLHLPFRAEKRSAQASAHPLSQAQGGLFCVLTGFVCCWSSE